jgi:ComF family protein
MWSWLLDGLFPPCCIGCSRRGVALCGACRLELPYLPGQVCVRCAAYRPARGGCRGCRRLSPAVGWVRAPFAYAGAARSAVLTLKFRSGRYLAPLMGELLCSGLSGMQFDAIVPVPLSPNRLRQRGFNQAELLAARVADSLEAPLEPGALSRIERPSQRSLGAAGRLSNLAGAFACGRDLHGRRVLLVDDVVTTGATVSACADTLAHAGAGRVCVLAFARDL